MRAVDLQYFELRRPCAMCGRCERLYDGSNLSPGQLGWYGIAVAKRNRAGRDRLPATIARRNGRASLPGDFRTRFTPRMRELNARYGALLLDEGRDVGERLD